MQEVRNELPLERPQLKRPRGQRREEHAVRAGHHQLGGIREGPQQQLPALLELVLVVYVGHDHPQGLHHGLPHALSLVFTQHLLQHRQHQRATKLSLEIDC